jgi:hypothetical protein
MSTKTIFAPSKQNIAFANKAIEKLDFLAKKRQVWESTDYKKANEGVYGLLAEELDLYQNKFVNASDDDRKTLRQELTARLTADGIRVQNNTTILTMMVRYVFSSDRKRAHGYTYVLKAAISYDIEAKDLPQFIKDAGGIEEIKRKMVVSEKALANKAEREKALLEVKADVEKNANYPLANVSIDLASNKETYAVLVTRANAQGTSDVVAILKNAEEKFVESILKKIAKDKLASQKEDDAIKAETATLGVKANNVLPNTKPANDEKFDGEAMAA